MTYNRVFFLEGGALPGEEGGCEEEPGAIYGQGKFNLLLPSMVISVELV